MSEEITPPENDSSEFTDLLSGLAKRRDGSLVANRYQIEKHLGGGGMGDVYLVKDTELKDEYRALKLIKGQFVSNETDLKRFQNEVRLTSRLDHPNIVRVFEYGVDGGELYYTMQYVKGKSLRELLEDHDNKLPLDRALQILTELARALEHAHDQKVIHRDLKPENIIIPDDGSPIKLTDFGLARSVEENEERLTKLDSALGGTANYMSPEQAAESTDIDHRSDIYSFGILAFELATGRVPFEGLPGIVKHMHREEPIPSPKKFNRKLPGWFVNIIEACTKKNKEERYQSFAEIARVLEKQSYSFHWRSSRAHMFQNVKLYLVPLIFGILHIVLFVSVPGEDRTGLVAPFANEFSTNHLFKLRGYNKPSDDIAIIAIDEESYAKLNVRLDQRWPREHTAALLRKLAPLKPKAVYLDMHFTSNIGNEKVNFELASALSQTNSYIGKFKDEQGNWILPDKLFIESSRGMFDATAPVSQSGYLRRFSAYVSGIDSHDYFAQTTYFISLESHAHPDKNDLINFYGPSREFKTVPFYEVLNGESSEELRGKYILVGLSLKVPSGVSYSDTHRTVFSERLPGVEVHATKLNNVLDKNWITQLDAMNDLMLNYLVCAIGVFFVLVSSGRIGIVVTVVLSGIWFMLVFQLFKMNITVSGLLMPVLFIFAYVLNFISLMRYRSKR